MDTNEKKVDVDTTQDIDKEVETTDEVETTEDKPTPKQEEKKDKPSETLEAREARLLRQLEQTRKKLGKVEDKSTETSNSNDLGEKAYLIANGIKGADEVSFFNKLKKETGKDTESLLDSAYFQTELKDFREKKASANAIPSSNKRKGSDDSLDYWVAKYKNSGELPPVSEVELRRKVVNAMTNKEKEGGMFYNQ